MSAALSQAELEQHLEEALTDPLLTVPSWRGSVDDAAESLVGLNRDEQDLVIQWVGRVAAVHEELAYQFSLRARRALELMDGDALATWLGKIMDVYDSSGLFPAMKLLKGMEEHAAAGPRHHGGVPFVEVERVLKGFVGGLAGRHLTLDMGEPIYCDSEVIWLPEVLGEFPDKADNFRLFKAIIAHHWAQTRYGTFRRDLSEVCDTYPKPDRALATVHALETLRLDARLQRELPGLYREMTALREAAGAGLPPGPWQGYARRLASPQTSIDDTLALLADAYATEPPAPAPYQGTLVPERVTQVRALRMQREKEDLRRLLVDLANEADARTPPAAPHRPDGARQFELELDTDAEAETIHLHLDGRPIAPPDNVSALLRSVLQDLGEIPEEYLVAAGSGSYASGRRGDGEEDGAAGTAAAGTHLYPEWNCNRQSYHKNWCTLREVPLRPRDDDFHHRTLERHSALIKHLRRSFEALRGGERRLKRQAYGDEVDLDALVEAHADAATGMEMSEHLFSRLHRVERDIAVVFLVDMSGSTKGWINDAERESLVLLCEALESLGDRYGIYGFSGMTRIRCEIFPIKGLDEPYDAAVRGRISAIEPKDYTRMGAAIRHVTAILERAPVKTRLLVTLSDGKPDDFDAYYRGDYGIEDTRQALIEAKRVGIHPFCITIDQEGPEYLPHMFGPVGYTVVDDVRKLPLKVADIYRRLTT